MDDILGIFSEEERAFIRGYAKESGLGETEAVRLLALVGAKAKSIAGADLERIMGGGTQIDPGALKARAS